MSPKVKIYIETDIHGPRARGGKYMYLMEAIRNGKPETRFGSGEGCENENGLVIRALCEAMGRLRKNCSVIVITECNAVRSTLQNDWIRQWQASGWKNAKGKPVSHREAWEQLSGRMEGQEITVEDGKEHSYKSWMQSQMQRKWKGAKGK